jgi:hypothetical protein
VSITNTYQVAMSSTDGTRVQGSSAETGTTQVVVNTQLPAASTNVSVACAFTVANVQGIILLANQNCTIKTNSSGSPANTINLIAGIPLIWLKSAGYFSNPFTVDVTSWFVTCTPATTLQAAILTT